MIPGAGFFLPQGHNFNNFGREPLDNVESSGPFSFSQDFWKLHFKNLLMQQTGMVWTTLVEDHQGIIPVKFGQNPMSDFRGEVV